MAKKLTLEFRGLCAYVRDRNKHGAAGRLTVLMLDAGKAGMRGYPTHAPQMVLPSGAIRGQNGKGSGSRRSVVRLGGRGVQIQTAGGAKLTFAPEFQKVASLESIRSGYGRVDGKCMKDKSPRPVVASRIQVTGGKVTARSQGKFARKEWRFQPPTAKARGSQVLADLVRVTVAGESGPFSIVLTDLKTGKVKRQVRIDPSAAATIKFQNEPAGTASGHAHDGAQGDTMQAGHFAICYEVSAEGRELAARKRPIPVLAAGGQASDHAHQGHNTRKAGYAASSSTVFCPGAALYVP